MRNLLFLAIFLVSFSSFGFDLTSAGVEQTNRYTELFTTMEVSTGVVGNLRVKPLLGRQLSEGKYYGQVELSVPVVTTETFVGRAFTTHNIIGERGHNTGFYLIKTLD